MRKYNHQADFVTYAVVNGECTPDHFLNQAPNQMYFLSEMKHIQNTSLTIGQ